jgi:2-methylisocitrate lyase-like PEP mutase family enzyme
VALLRQRVNRLLELHKNPKLLSIVNVWGRDQCHGGQRRPGDWALATASHSIAATRGYEDGENIPVDEMLEEVRRIVAATDLPVTADLEGDYGNAAETIRKAIGVDVAGANIEDQMKPWPRQQPRSRPS